MKLIGYKFFQSQQDFEDWQIQFYTKCNVHTVIPHLNTMCLRDDGDKYTLGQDVTSVWGIFVTYDYIINDTQ